MANYKRKDGQRDFPELEGKIINHHFRDGRIEKVKIVGCNYDIGITMVYCDKTDKEAYCSNGASSPHSFLYWEDTYDRGFYAAIRMINRGIFKGIIDFAIINEISVPEARNVSSTGNSIMCAFKA